MTTTLQGSLIYYSYAEILHIRGRVRGSKKNFINGFQPIQSCRVEMNDGFLGGCSPQFHACKSIRHRLKVLHTFILTTACFIKSFCFDRRKPKQHRQAKKKKIWGLKMLCLYSSSYPVQTYSMMHHNIKPYAEWQRNSSTAHTGKQNRVHKLPVYLEASFMRVKVLLSSLGATYHQRHY